MTPFVREIIVTLYSGIDASPETNARSHLDLLHIAKLLHSLMEEKENTQANQGLDFCRGRERKRKVTIVDLGLFFFLVAGSLQKIEAQGHIFYPQEFYISKSKQGHSLVRDNTAPTQAPWAPSPNAAVTASLPLRHLLLHC